MLRRLARHEKLFLALHDVARLEAGVGMAGDRHTRRDLRYEQDCCILIARKVGLLDDCRVIPGEADGSLAPGVSSLAYAAGPIRPNAINRDDIRKPLDIILEETRTNSAATERSPHVRQAYLDLKTGPICATRSSTSQWEACSCVASLTEPISQTDSEVQTSSRARLLAFSVSWRRALCPHLKVASRNDEHL
jgi:hypothetical protein